jgi:hypothetical protein
MIYCPDFPRAQELAMPLLPEFEQGADVEQLNP